MAPSDDQLTRLEQQAHATLERYQKLRSATDGLTAIAASADGAVRG